MLGHQKKREKRPSADIDWCILTNEGYNKFIYGIEWNIFSCCCCEGWPGHTIFIREAKPNSQSSMGFPEHTKWKWPRESSIYIRRGHISEGLICFLFFTAAAAAAIAIFLRMTTVSHRGSIRHRRKPIRCQPADLIIHERKKRKKKKCGNGMLPMLTLLVCLFI